MAESKLFECSVVTPEQVVIECEARFVALPAHDGEVGILKQRAPLLTRLDVGPLRIEKGDGETESFFIDGGFAEMVGNRLTVLTESAVTPDEVAALRHYAERRQSLELNNRARLADTLYDKLKDKVVPTSQLTSKEAFLLQIIAEKERDR